MKNNIIELKSVREILGMKFVIPGYQRGYRWTDQQVIDLLKDINDFMSDPTKSQQFYCIQPLVIKECVTNKDGFIEKLNQIKDDVLEETRKLIEENTKWEVIDGQQRLTTIHILLSYLKSSVFFSIEYLTRENSTTYINDIANKGKEAEENIDFYHMRLAYETISKWFETTDCDKQRFLGILLDKVKFIWYQSVGENPIKVFTRLNIGKISLTNSELIKALCLNRSNFAKKENETHKLSQFEIASQWDRIEYALQNDEFWLFLHDTGYKRPTRIDFIFDIICEQNELGSFDNLGSDEYRTFRYFYEYFRSSTCDIDVCWAKVNKYFQIFQEWYNDLELYHYIGFLIADGNKLYDLVKAYSDEFDKEKFLDDLKSKIYGRVGKPSLDFQYKEDGSDKGKCRHILLFHNIQTVINQNTKLEDNDKYEDGVFYKFPFHLFKKESWDVEHINSNTTNPEDDINTQKEWMVNVFCGVSEELKQKIRDFFVNPSKDNYESIRKQVNTGEEWDQKDKNRIWNYTLLDSSTNRSYGNSIFSAKRRIIVGKDKGVQIAVPRISKSGDFVLGEEKGASSSFVPPCTKHVFLKYYSSLLSDFNYWDRDVDAVSYLKDIESCINILKKKNHEQ